MKKILTRVVSLLLCCFMALTVVGCDHVQVRDTNESVSDYSTIPKDGIVKKDIFKLIIDTGEMGLFSGKNGEFTYQWAFMPEDINSPRDLNLLVNKADSQLDLVKKESGSDIVYGFKFPETTPLDSKTALSFIFKGNLKCTTGEVYQVKNKKLSKVSSATVDNEEGTTFNFSIKDREGEFYLVGSDVKTSSVDKSDNSSSSTSTSEGSSSTDPSSNQTTTTTEGKEITRTDSGSYVVGGSSSGGGTTNSTDSAKREQLAQDSYEYKKEHGINMDKGVPGQDGKDKYLTDPTPPGKPKPVEWNENGNKVDKSKVAGYVTLSITCKNLLDPDNRKVAVENGKGDMIPKDGIIYKTKKVKFYKNEFVFDVLLREVKEHKIQMEYSMTPIYNSNYIEGIHNLYEFDGGPLSGWMYSVNGWFPNYGCSRYKLKDGDVIKWVYTCDLGKDVGCEWIGNS